MLDVLNVEEYSNNQGKVPEAVECKSDIDSKYTFTDLVKSFQRELFNIGFYKYCINKACKMDYNKSIS